MEGVGYSLAMGEGTLKPILDDKNLGQNEADCFDISAMKRGPGSNF